MISIVDIGASDVTEGAMTVQAGNSDDEEFQAFEATPVFGQLGLASRPYPADTSACQALLAETPASAQVVAMRDTRNAAVLATLEPGDSVVFSTGPALIRIYLRENGEVQVTNCSKTVVGDGVAAKAVAIAEMCEAEITKVVDAVKSLCDAITGGVPAAGSADGGTALLASIAPGIASAKASLTGVPASTAAAKLFSE